MLGIFRHLRKEYPICNHWDLPTALDLKHLLSYSATESTRNRAATVTTLSGLRWLDISSRGSAPRRFPKLILD